MRALLQRVSRASVASAGREVARIGPGLLVLLGISPRDDEVVSSRLAGRIAGLRIFADGHGKTNLAIGAVGGSALVISQFTLYADLRGGRRPSFADAGPPELAERLYGHFCRTLAELGVPVAQGTFGAAMTVELVNDGPFTLWLDTDAL